MANVTIRPAIPTDGPTIIYFITALADYESLPPPDDAARQRLVADAFADKPRFEVFIAEVDGAPAGYAFIFETYSTILALPTLYLEDLFVLPEFRNQRVGFALFRYCVTEAHRRGCGRMEWAVLDWNEPSIQFYQRQGAHHMTEWHHYRLNRDDLVRLIAIEE